jgi:exonuclease VII large subunit
MRAYGHRAVQLLDQVRGRLEKVTPQNRLTAARAQVEHLHARVGRASVQKQLFAGQQLKGIILRLENLNPRAVLGRGYSITRLKKGNRIVTEEALPHPDDVLVTELANKVTLESKVTSVPEKKGES